MAERSKRDHRGRKTGAEVFLRPVRTSAGIQAQYHRLLLKRVREISREVSAAILEQYRADGPAIALDETPAEKLSRLMSGLRERLSKKADADAEELGAWFVGRVQTNVAARMKEAFKAAGVGDFVIEFTTGAVQRDVFTALVQENVSLIKSIGSEYFTDIEGLVMRSVAAGRDLAALSQDLKARYDITARRAAMIARDQSNKATQALGRAQNIDAGFTRAEWMHFPGRKTSRKTHEAMQGKQFDLRQGCKVPNVAGAKDPYIGKYIQPGECIICNCSFRLILDKKLWKEI